MNSNSLFDLIKSLNKTEKRYFKLFAGQHGKAKNPLFLFDLIDKQREFEEESLKIKLFRAGIKTPLPVLKNTLIQLIIKSLQQYNASNNTDLEHKIKEQILQAEVLFNQGLIEEGSKLLDKAHEAAKQSERFLLQYEICEKTRRTRRFKHLEEKEQFINALFNEEVELLEKQQEYVAYVKLWNQFSILQHKGMHTRIDADIEGIKRILKHELLQDEYVPKSTRGLNFKLSTLGDCYRYLEDYEKALGYQVQAFEVKQEDSVYKNDKKTYISSIHNVLIHSLLSKNFEVTSKYMKMLHPDNFDEMPLKLRAFIRYYLNAVAAYKYSFSIKDGIQFIEENEPFLSENEIHFVPVHWGFSIFGKGILYFMDEQYEKAIDELDKIEHSPSVESFGDILTSVKLLKLFSYYELNERNYITHYMRSTERFLKSKKIMFEFESIMLKELKVLMNYVLAGDKKKGYADLVQKIQKLRDKRFERNTFNYFEFDIWLLSKIKGKSMKEISISLG